ncbi:unnamed protein product, partial [Tilletia controversa]
PSPLLPVARGPSYPDPSTSATLFPPLRKFNILPVSDAYASNTSPISSHWSLLLIRSPQNQNDHLTTYHFDSLDPHNTNAAARCIANFAEAFGRIPTQIRAVGGKHGWGSGSGSGDRGQKAKMEAQENAWDCGIYVLALTQALVHRLAQDGGGVDAAVERVVREEATPKKIAQWRARFYRWVRRWQAEARKEGGGVWDSKEEVVAALGPWCADEDEVQQEQHS